MGDVIHAMPAVAALRAAHPELYIGWAIEPRWSPLLTACERSCARGDQQPLVDGVHRVPFQRWARTPSLATAREMRTIRNELRAGNYDTSLDLQGSLRSAWLQRWTGAKRLIGEADPREKPARFLFTERVATSGVHVIEQDLELCGAIFGDSTLPYSAPPFPRVPEAESWAEARTAYQPCGLLLPGAGWGSKRWRAERYGEVGRALIARGLRCFFNAGPGEEQLAEEAARVAGPEAKIISPDIPQLIALLARTRLCIGGDTGPLHLASALGVATVGIYGPTDPSRNGPYATEFRVLRHPESARDHARRDAPEAGLLTITAHDVIAAANDLLGARP